MPPRKVMVLQDDEAWNQYLLEVFEDTVSTPEISRIAKEILPLIGRRDPDVVFANAALLTKPLLAALQTQKASRGNFRSFLLGASPQSLPTNFSGVFDESFNERPSKLYDFHRKMVQHLPLPDPIRLLVVDDEPDVGEAFREFFGQRREPTFVVETAQDGAEGLRRIEATPPHVLVLDIKMPHLDGREVFRELKKIGRLPPTIVFFDLVSADEVLEIRKWGNPAFVEKGSRASSLPEMDALIKKMAYFA